MSISYHANTTNIFPLVPWIMSISPSMPSPRSTTATSTISAMMAMCPQPCNKDDQPWFGVSMPTHQVSSSFLFSFQPCVDDCGTTTTSVGVQSLSCPSIDGRDSPPAPGLALATTAMVQHVDANPSSELFFSIFFPAPMLMTAALITTSVGAQLPLP